MYCISKVSLLITPLLVFAHVHLGLVWITGATSKIAAYIVCQAEPSLSASYQTHPVPMTSQLHWAATENNYTNRFSARWLQIQRTMYIIDVSKASCPSKVFSASWIFADTNNTRTCLSSESNRLDKTSTRNRLQRPTPTLEVLQGIPDKFGHIVMLVTNDLRTKQYAAEKNAWPNTEVHTKDIGVDDQRLR